jgi:predicted AAA+ superfamily ATPase
MNRETLATRFADLPDLLPANLTPRTLELPAVPGRADVVIGMRRSGKTWFLYQLLRQHLDSGIGWDRLLYINFEDDRLHPIEAKELGLIPEVFYRRHPASREQRCWFFLDEIQAAPGWERFVRRLLETENVSLVLTGSSAKLLSREIATSLRGRSLASELLPFSFGEALQHAGLEVPTQWPVSSKVRSRLANRLERYLEVGGFPEVQELDPDRRLRVLRDHVDVVLFRDVVERHGVENVHALRYMQRSLLAHPAGRFSVHRLYNDLKSQGVSVGKDTLHQYLAHLEDAFLLFTVTVASRSERVRQSNPRKCYPVDPGLAAMSSSEAGRDIGHRLETAVYLELRRRGCSASYFRTEKGYEVDFLVRNPSGEKELVQVCADLSDEATRERESRALEHAMEETRLRHATVVTFDGVEEDELDTPGVRSVPAWRWLLESSKRST